jgi:Tfp pilus assembly protein PilO
MATEIQNEIEMQLNLFEELMNETELNLYPDDELDESDPLPSDEEMRELEQDLAQIALETNLRNYTFTRVIPTKKLVQKCQQF